MRPEENKVFHKSFMDALKGTAMLPKNTVINFKNGCGSYDPIAAPFPEYIM